MLSFSINLKLSGLSTRVDQGQSEAVSANQRAVSDNQRAVSDNQRAVSDNQRPVSLKDYHGNHISLTPDLRGFVDKQEKEDM